MLRIEYKRHAINLLQQRVRRCARSTSIKIVNVGLYRYTTSLQRLISSTYMCVEYNFIAFVFTNCI